MSARRQQLARRDRELKVLRGCRRAGQRIAQDAGERGDAREPDARQGLRRRREAVEAGERYAALLPRVDLVGALKTHENVLDEAEPPGGVRDGAGVGEVEDGDRLRPPAEHLGQLTGRDLYEMAEVAGACPRVVQQPRLVRLDRREPGDVPGDRPDQRRIAADLLDHEPEREAEPFGLTGQQSGVGLHGVGVDHVRVGWDGAGAVQRDRHIDERGVAGQDSVQEHGQSFRSCSERRRISITRSAPARMGLIRTVRSASSGASSRDELDMR